MYIHPQHWLTVRHTQGCRFDGPRGCKRNLSSGLIRHSIYTVYIPIHVGPTCRVSRSK